jgi:cytoskeletal protein CcmA (bactofilin family)
MDNNAVVSGFQFTIDDDPDYYSFVSIDASGRVPADWSLSGSENGGNATVLGFSFQGTQIEPGSGAIATVIVDPMDMEFISDLCFDDAVVSDPLAGAYFSFAGCSEFMNPFSMPIELTATGGPGFVSLDWIVEEDTRTRATVDLSITNYANGQIEVSMTNQEAVGGFQFDIDAGNGLSGLSVTNASGGSAADAGFTVSTNSSGLVLGFSFSGATMPVGTSVLCYVDGTFTGENGELSISSATMSDASGNSLDVDLGMAFYVGVQETYGCMDPEADNYNPDATVDNGDCEYGGCTDPLADNYDEGANVNDGSCVYPPSSYTVFRDGQVIATGVDVTGYVDSGLGASQTYCYVVAKVDMGEVTAESNEACATTDATVTQELSFSPYLMNMTALNVMPSDMSTESVFGALDLLLMKSDDSDYYVPDFGVDQIGSINNEEGYKVFLNGPNSQMLSITGAPLNGGGTILNAYTMNLLPFLMQECMSTDDVFAGYEDNILLVKNDSDQFYVPAFGVQTMSQMCPGEAYAVFLNGGEDVDFTYPMGVALSSSHSDYYVEDYISRTKTQDVALTGESHLILLTDIAGEVAVGDQLRAYANGSLVGSINIVEEHVNGTHPIDLAAVGSVDMSNYGGPVLDGYISGDMIELRLMSLDRGVELKVEADLSDMQYGNVMELSTGSITVLDESAIVTSLELTQNYPNPFNPSTTISYNVDASGMVSLKVYDIMGRLVRTLVDNHRSSGNLGGYSVVWDGKDSQGQQVAAGLYIYSLQTPGGNMTKKMVLMK